MTVDAYVTSQAEQSTHGVAGAVSVPDGIDAGIPWHFGDPIGEQRQLVRSAGIVDRSNRGVLTVSGRDRLPWLHSIITQHVTALADGDATEALVLSPHGHVEQHWQLAELDGQVWLDVEPGMAPDALKYLSMMRFLKEVEPLDVSTEYAVYTLAGPWTRVVLNAAGLPNPEAGQAIAISSGGFVRGLPASVADVTQAADLVLQRWAVADVLARLEEAGAGRVGSWAYEALRVQARRPRLRFETDHRTIAHEVGWIGSAVHLDKGCYRGQETVARVQNLGKPPRRLVLLHLDGSTDTLPEPGTDVEFLGRTVGFVGTAVHHHELGPVALALIKRSLADDSVLRVGDQQVSIDSSDPNPSDPGEEMTPA
jgi:folate-binding protein YgfZ